MFQKVLISRQIRKQSAKATILFTRVHSIKGYSNWHGNEIIRVFINRFFRLIFLTVDTSWRVAPTCVRVYTRATVSWYMFKWACLYFSCLQLCYMVKDRVGGTSSGTSSTIMSPCNYFLTYLLHLHSLVF